MAIRKAAWTVGLCSLVVASSIDAQGMTIPHPGNTLAEHCFSVVSECVPVSGNAPHVELICPSIKNVVDQICRKQLRQSARDHIVLTSPENALAVDGMLVEREAEIIRKGEWQQTSICLIRDPVCRSVAGVYQAKPYFERLTGCAVLGNGQVIYYRQVSSHLHLAKLALRSPDLGSNSDALGSADRDRFHCGGSACGFFNVSIGRIGSVNSYFARFLGIANGVSSLTPEQGGKQPQPSSKDGQRPGKPGYPPVWFRIPAALILGLGSNGVLVWGLIVWDDGRRIVGGLACAIALLMFVGGGTLMMLLAFPRTWGWWI